VAEVAWRPTPEYVENANVTRFMRAHGIATADEFRRRSTDDVEWFWDAVVKDLGFEFSSPYERVLDSSGGPAWGKWFIGGRINLTYNCVDRHAASDRADVVAVIGELEDGAVHKLTYAELKREVDRIAAGLRSLGVRKGDRVAVFMPMVIEAVVAAYAVAKLGAVYMPIFSGFAPSAVAARLQDAEAKVLITADGGLRRGSPALMKTAADEAVAESPSVKHVIVYERLGVDVPMTPGRDITWAELRVNGEKAEPGGVEPEDTGAEDELMIAYTSGTTGKPKGAMLTHLNLLMNVEALALSAFDIGGDDRVLGCLPLFHSFGQTVAMNTSFRVGATVVMLPRFDAIEALRLLVEERCTIFMGVPTMYVALLAAGRRSETRPPLRFAVSGGASLPVTVLEAFESMFRIPVYEGYGLTETSPVATFNQKDWPPKPGTIGRAIWGVDVEIARAEVEKSIELLPTGELGELVVRGHNVMKGYLNRPDATAEVMVDGWFRTGDLGTKDEDGYLTIVDRKKDMVLRGGYNVYPREVEEVLLRNPAVGQVAVIGVPDARLGEEVCAVVIPADGAEPDAAAIVAWGKQALAAYKYPRRIEFVAEFPLGPSGKILKRELVARYRS
jgi:long-chain acyl-CoA synthetase